MSDTLDDDADVRKEEAQAATDESQPFSGANAQDQPGGIPVATYGTGGAGGDSAGAPPGFDRSPGLPGGGAARPAPTRDIAPALRAAGIPERRIANIERQIAMGNAIRAATHPPKVKDAPWDAGKAEIDPNSPSFSLAPPEPEKEHTWYGDHAREAWKRTIEMGAGLTGLAEGVASQVQSMPELQEWLTGKRKELQAYAADQIKEMSPERQKAFASSLIEKGAPSPTGDLTGYLASTMATAVPDALLMTLGAVPVVGKVVMAIYGGMTAGQSYTELADKIGTAKDSDLLNSDFYRELRSQGKDEKEAKRQLISHLAPILMGIQAAIGTAGSVVPIQAVKGQIGGAVGRGVLGRVGLGALEAGTGAGAAGVASNVAQQVAEGEGKVRTGGIDWGEAARSGAAWGIPSAIFGGAGHALTGKRPSPKIDPDNPQTTHDPSIVAAADEQLSGKPKPGEEETAPAAPPAPPTGGLPGAGKQLPGTTPPAGPPPAPGEGVAPPGAPPTAPPSPPTAPPGLEAAAGIKPPGTPPAAPPAAAAPPAGPAGPAAPAAPTAPPTAPAAPPVTPVVDPIGNMKRADLIDALKAEAGLSANKAKGMNIAALKDALRQARAPKPAAPTTAAPEVTVAQPAVPGAPPEAAAAPAAPRSPHQIQREEGLGFNAADAKARAEGWQPPPEPTAEPTTGSQPEAAPHPVEQLMPADVAEGSRASDDPVLVKAQAEADAAAQHAADLHARGNAAHAARAAARAAAAPEVRITEPEPVALKTTDKIAIVDKPGVLHPKRVEAEPALAEGEGWRPVGKGEVIGAERKTRDNPKTGAKEVAYVIPKDAKGGPKKTAAKAPAETKATEAGSKEPTTPHTTEAEPEVREVGELGPVAGITTEAEVVKAPPKKAEATPAKAEKVEAAAPVKEEAAAPPAKKTTVGEDLRTAAAAKRAAQKAKLAPPGERQKSAAHVGEEVVKETKAVPEQEVEGEARANEIETDRSVKAARRVLHATASEAGRKLEPEHIQKMLDSFDNVMRDVQSPEQVLKLMTRWGETGSAAHQAVVDTSLTKLGQKRGLETREAERKETMSKRDIIADIQTDKRPDKQGGDVEDKLAETGGRYDPSEARQEVAREQAPERSAKEADKPRGELNDVLHEDGDEGGGSEGVSDYEGGKDYKPTRDLAKKGNRLIAEVMDDSNPKTIHQASEEFGKKEPGKRSRRWDDLAHFIRDRKTLAESTEHFDNLVELGKERETLRKERGKRDEDRGSTSKRETRLREIEKEMNRLVKAGDPHLVDELNQMLSDLKTGPRSEYQADFLRPGETVGGRPVGMARGGEIGRMMRDHAVNERIERAMLDSESAWGTPAGLHELLDIIIKAKDLPKELAHYRTLAKILRKRTPEDVPVMSKGWHDADPWGVGVNVPPGTAGAMMHSKAGNVSHLMIDHDVTRGTIGNVETLLHEGLHTLTSHYIKNLKPGDRDYKVLMTIMKEMHRLDLSDPQSLHGFFEGVDEGAVNYAKTSINELHTVMMTSPAIQAWARDVTPSSTFTREMAAHGYPVGKGPGGVWKSFMGFMKRALGGDAVNENLPPSFLDHIMKPLSDIAERGSEHSRNIQTRSQMLTGYATPHYRRVGGESAHERETAARLKETGKFRETLDRAMDKVDPVGKSDALSKGLLQWAPLDSIVGWNKKLVQGVLDRAHNAIDEVTGKKAARLEAIKSDPLEAFRDAQAKASREEKAFRDEYHDKVDNLLSRLSHKESAPVAQLMHDVSMADAQVGPGASNRHLTGEELKAAGKLQERFEALTPSQKTTYLETRDLRRDWYRQKRDADLHNLLTQFVPELTSAQRDSLVETMRTKTGIEEVIKGDDGSSVAKALGTAWKGNKRFVKMVGELHRLGHVQGDYFPMRRDGNYVVRYGDKTDKSSYGVEMFKNRGKAEARRAELAAAGHDVAQVMLRRESDLRDISPDSNLIDQFEDRIKSDKNLSPHAAAIRDELKNLLLESATSSEKVRTAMRRERIAGAEIDPAKHLAQDYVRMGAALGNARNGAARRMALGDLRTLIKEASNYGKPGEAITMQQVLTELEKRVATVGDHNDIADKIGHAATQITFMKSLLSPAHALYNTIDIHSTALAHLGARHNYAGATAALTRAMRQLGPGMIGKAVGGSLSNISAFGKGLKAKDWNLSEYAQERLTKAGADAGQMATLFEAANKRGLLDHTEITDIRRMAKGAGGNVATKTWTKFQQMITFGVHAVDEMNKAGVLKAAFDLEMRKNGGDVEAASKHAAEMLAKSTPNRAAYSKARIATKQGTLGPLAAPAMQFRSYGLWMHGMMAVEARNMMHGATPAERREARWAFAGVLGTHALSAGLLGTAGIAGLMRYGGGLYDWATGAEKPHNWANDFRHFLSSTFGPTLGEAIAIGLPSLAGMDIHRSIGTADLLNVPQLDSFKAAGFKSLAMTLFGPSGENTIRAIADLAPLFHGDMTALKSFVPRPIGDVAKAISLGTQGLKDTRGKTLLEPGKISAADIAIQALGMQPAKVAGVRAQRAAILEAKQEAQSARTKALQTWMQAMDKKRAGDAAEAVRQFNKSHKDNPITVGNLLQARKAAADAKAHPEKLGLNLPKRGAQKMIEAGRFGNYGS